MPTTTSSSEPASMAASVDIVGVRPRGTVIVAAYNERSGLPLVLDALESVKDADLEVIVVDDGSTDGTHEVAARRGTTLVRHARNRGKGAAIMTGVDAATTDIVVCIDADNTYPVSAIPDMIRCLRRCDLVFATRATGRENIPIFNRFGNRAFASVMQGVTRRRLADPLTGLYALYANDLRRMRIRSRGFGIEAEIAIKSAAMRLAICEHPIFYSPRAGNTKLRPVRDGMRIAATIAVHSRLGTRLGWPAPDLPEPCVLLGLEPALQPLAIAEPTGIAPS